ncbi:MAG: alpha/beta hydrolase, partial [Clostridia bacterium]|nr:alpha/beta hydrolase [Clostridia bacterium]
IVKTVNTEVEAHAPIDTPILVIWGELDELVPQASLDFLSKQFVNMQTIIYKDVGHLLMLSNRDGAFIQTAVKFLTDGKVDKEIPPRQSK